MGRSPKQSLSMSWLPAFVLGVLISIIGYLLTEQLDDMKMTLKEIGLQVTEQAKEFVRLETRVDVLERTRK